MIIPEHLQNYPVGPKLAEWLEIDQGKTEEFDTSKRGEFKDFILRYIEENDIKSENQLIDLLDEFVSMDLPDAALKLADFQARIWTRRDFRGTQAEGIAAMILGDLARAEMCFKHAHHAAPEEPAPYTNLVQVLYHEDRLEDAQTWLDAGLNTNPNYYRLWELLFALEQKKGKEQQVINKSVYEKAKQVDSWAGYSLASETDSDANSQTKAMHLSTFYSQGERDTEFLIEYTGALGAAGDFEKIPQICWQAKKNSSGKKLPWRLNLHAAQAFLSLGRHEEFLTSAEDVLAEKHLPDEVKIYIEQLKKDAEEELMTATNQKQD